MRRIQNFTQAMWLGIAVLMLIPILMAPLSLALPQPVNRWANIIVAVFFFLFNLVKVCPPIHQLTTNFCLWSASASMS